MHRLQALRVLLPPSPSIRRGYQTPSPALLLGHKRGKTVLPGGMPARQCRTVLYQVANRPSHALLVHLAGDVIVGTKNVEVASSQPLEHEVHHLFRRPGTWRLLGHPLSGHAGEGKAGNEQMRRYPL